jgi:hypothetical protein
MRLDATGQPLHTRALSVAITTRADDRLDVAGSIVDLRKRGFVPVAGDLQGPGLIHDMRLAGTIDPATGTLERLVADQRNVAFEASAATGGESCRDPIDRVAAMAGTRLDAGWARRLAAEIGGPRGCSHLLALGHLLGSAAARALARERALHAAAPRRPAGQRVFRRDLVVDGHEPGAGRLELTAQLTDLHFAPAGPLAVPMDRFAEQLEVRVLAEVDFAGGGMGGIARAAAAERRRGVADFADAVWRERPDAAEWLVGRRLGAGITGELLARFGTLDHDRPLLDVLLSFAPALVQCAAAMSEAWPLAARIHPTLIGMGGLPDSCWMWRRDGGLARARAAEGDTERRRP